VTPNGESPDPESRIRELLDRVHSARRDGDERAVADRNFELGDAYAATHRYPEATRSYASARHTYIRLDLPDEVAACHAGLGDVSASTARFGGAEQAYAAARAPYIALDQPEKVADCQMNLGTLYQALGRYADAERAYAAALATYLALDLQEKAADCEKKLTVSDSSVAGVESDEADNNGSGSDTDTPEGGQGS
jgi:tetratricopeptide (TPR) repeat protein